MAPDYDIPVLGKTFKIIDQIASTRKGLSFSDLLEELDFPKTTLFRILRTLEKANWIVKRNERYHLGFMVLHYGLAELSNRDIRKIALPFMEELRDRVGETVHLAIPSGYKSMIIEVCESKKHIKLSSPIGSLIDMYCSAHGKVFLAFLHKDEIHSIYKDEKMQKRTPSTITGFSRLEKELDTVFFQGYAVDEREYYDDVRCIAVPVYDYGNTVIGAIGITATTNDLTPEMIPELVKHARDCGNRISREMGNSISI